MKFLNSLHTWATQTNFEGLKVFKTAHFKCIRHTEVEIAINITFGLWR